MNANIKKIIAKTFDELATGLETGSFGNIPKIALMGAGSEHGAAEMEKGAEMAATRGIAPHFIGGDCEAEATAKMVEMLKSGEVDGAVAMHYTFPIGVATVGKVVTPATGRELYIATTTGTSATERVSAMVLGAIYGIIAAKASGVKNPPVGILNIDGARQAERALRELADSGYDINFAKSKRADGGVIMRG
ncbi:MAG: glycine reductase, partial [Clostridiales bacterium]|nr:glycine reductase [Clostridiales bacterium]